MQTGENMHFIDKQSKEQLEYYKRIMSYIGSLSRLFSESNKPYYNYRISENLFCKAFDADNLSRSDISADARKNSIGVGIKTFLEGNGHTFQKVAEFSGSEIRQHGNDIDLVRSVAELRNKRLQTTKNVADLDNLIYHCIVRNTGYMRIYEIGMDSIDIDSISLVKNDRSSNTIWFEDRHHLYNFSRSKTTLLKRFDTPDNHIDVDIDIFEDPFAILENLIHEIGELSTATQSDEAFVLLPLFSDKQMEVQEKSGLNQWNAAGRKRHHDEVYIPIPAWIHREFPDFFPARDENFTLKLPNNKAMSAKVCQDNSKALMSNPNKALGEWLLREVLELAPRELLTIAKLRATGLDSVIIYKMADGEYSIDFKQVGSYEDFKADYS